MPHWFFIGVFIVHHDKTLIMKKPGFIMAAMLSAIALLITVQITAQPLNIKKLAVDYDKMLLEQFKPDETGCAALVAKGGQIIYHKAFGLANMELNVPMQPEMVFRIDRKSVV